MAISDKKTRISLVIKKDDKAILEKLAKQDELSVNYVINKAIKQYIKEREKEIDAIQ